MSSRIVHVQKARFTLSTQYPSELEGSLAKSGHDGYLVHETAVRVLFRKRLAYDARRCWAQVCFPIICVVSPRHQLYYTVKIGRLP